MKRLVVIVLAGLACVAAPVGAAAAASPTVRMAIVHTVRGCHVWQTGTTSRGPATKVTLKRGARLELRATFPMDFDLAQVAGPRHALGPPRMYAGTTRTLVFQK